MAPATLLAEEKHPSRTTLTWFVVRVILLRAKRSAKNLSHPIPKLKTNAVESYPTRVAFHRSSLITVGTKERNLELGKIQNLRIAAKALNGLEIPSGITFSFWRNIGRCRKGAGYAEGRQLQEGCLVPVVGGGICQLSNALYDVALKAGCEILERHPHSRIVPGSAASRDRDATVAWNHIDLRWKSNFPMRLAVCLTPTHLEVALWSNQSLAVREKPAPLTLRQVIDPSAHSCGRCDQTGCVLHGGAILPTSERTAFLVDEVWPEFDRYLQTTRTEKDLLCLPLRGRANYDWNEKGFGQVLEAKWSTLVRSFRSRRLADQGPARQTAKLQSASELAKNYAARLKPDVTHLVITLDLLPFLWQSGLLGGRTFDVLMTRFPMGELQAHLDRAHKRNPNRGLLADFRAPQEIVKAEAEALAAARKLITPHLGVAKDDPRRVLLDWMMPAPTTWLTGDAIVFPGPTVARKGAYEVREVAKKLGAKVKPLGSELEGEDFWKGVPIAEQGFNLLTGGKALVQPAVLECRPQKLLKALASGCPIIITEACGIPPGPLVHIIPEGDVDAIITCWQGIQSIRA